MKKFLPLIVGVLLVGGCSAPAPDVPAMSTGTTASSAPAPAAPVTEPLDQPDRVEIPALGVVDEVVPVGLNPDQTMEVPPVTEVGWYELSVPVGAVGPAVLAGHVNWHGTPGSFGRIGELKNGDRVIVVDKDGDQLTFEVYDERQFPKAQFDYQFVYGDRDTADVVLVTCSGDVIDHNYTHNTAVAARLVTP